MEDATDLPTGIPAAVLEDDAPVDEPLGGEAYGPDGQLDDSLRVESEILEAPEVVQTQALDEQIAAGDAAVIAPPATPEEGEDPDALVEIINPDTPGDDTAQVTVAAYRQTWAAKGFKRVLGRRDDGSIVVAVNDEVDVNDSTTGSTDESVEPAPESEASTGTESDADTSSSKARKAR